MDVGARRSISIPEIFNRPKLSFHIVKERLALARLVPEVQALQ
jgi:hypothetical protein